MPRRATSQTSGPAPVNAVDVGVELAAAVVGAAVVAVVAEVVGAAVVAVVVGVAALLAVAVVMTGETSEPDGVAVVIPEVAMALFE
jgi:hypothetical protein